MNLRKISKLSLSLLATTLTPYPAQALEIVIDYTYDTSNFFDTDEKKAAIEAVAKFYGDMIQDNLLRIDPDDFSQATWTPTMSLPETGVSTPIPSLQVIPEDTIIVYVGARELGGSTAGIAGPGGFTAGGFQDWFARIRGRGNSGAESGTPSAQTDFALWGGSIAFDTPRNWNFSQSSNGSGSEFISIALHEMGHVLGMGSANSWNNLVDFDTFTFNGTNVLRSNGGVAPTADSGHFSGPLNSELFGSFSVTHGTSRPVLMLPSSTDTGSNFDVITDLDLAAMVDIGWELNPDLNFSASSLSPSGVALEWNTVSFKQYAVERSSTLPSFITVQANTDGDGTTDSFSNPSPPVDHAFYRIVSSDITGAAAAATRAPATKAVQSKTGTEAILTDSQEPVLISCPTF
ncbi:MAG: matrixin family metalloprotease [Opitutaceae bacterium]